MKLVFEILCAVVIVVWSSSAFVRYAAASHTAIEVIAYGAGWFAAGGVWWLAGDFLHRIWRTLRRQDIVA